MLVFSMSDFHNTNYTIVIFYFSADDLVKRLFTLEFNPRKTSMMALKKNIVSRVQRHNLDVGSAETRSKYVSIEKKNAQLTSLFPQ